MTEEPKVSIIIPCKEINNFVEECIKYCLGLDYKHFEIILLPDSKIEKKFPKTKIIPTGSVHPSIKRNIGIEHSDSPIIASIDSDAYPRKDWLTEAIKILEYQDIGGVSGPNLAPLDATIFEKAAITIVYSKLGHSTATVFGKYGHIREAKLAKELQSSNFIYKRCTANEVHGYDAQLATGEDTLISYKIRASGKKLIYSPLVVVYHHRRPLFVRHLKRVAEQATDKAIILKSHVAFDNMIFFVPSLFVLGLISGIVLSFLSHFMMAAYLTIVGIYIMFILNESRKAASLVEGFLIFIGLPLTHIWYGVGFLRGFFLKKYIVSGLLFVSHPNQGDT